MSDRANTPTVNTPLLAGLLTQVRVVLAEALVPLLLGDPGTGKTHASNLIAAAEYERDVRVSAWAGTDESVVESRQLRGLETFWSPGGLGQAQESALERKTLFRVSELQYASTALFQFLAPVLAERRLPFPSGRTLEAPLSIILESNDLHRIPDYLTDRCVVIEFPSWGREDFEALARLHGFSAAEAWTIGTAVWTHNEQHEPGARLSARAIVKYARLRGSLGAENAARLAFRPARGDNRALLDTLCATVQP